MSGYFYSGSPASMARRAAEYIDPRSPAALGGYFYSGSPASMVRRAADWGKPLVTGPVRGAVVKPAATKAKAAATAAAARSPAATKTLAQQAAEYVGMTLDPQVTSLQRGGTRAQLAAKDAAETLMRMSAGDVGQVQGAYQTAANQIAGYSQGLSGGLGATQQDAANRAAAEIAQLGLPSDAGAVPTGAAANANTNYMLGGILPSTQMAQEAAASVAPVAARELAAGRSMFDTAASAEAKAAQDIADLQATRPKLMADAMQALQTTELNKQQAGLERKKFDEEVRQYGMEYALKQSDSRRQDRALQIQAATLQLNEAKTVWDQAQALTNLTGSVYVVKNGKLVNTGKVATGSDAYVAAQTAQVQQQAITTRADTAAASLAGQNARSDAQIAAQTEQNQARIDAQDARAAEANRVKIQIAKDKASGKAVTPAQKATVLKGANAQGAKTVEAIWDRIKNNVPNAGKQGDNEDDGAYAKRMKNAQAEWDRRVKKGYKMAYGQVKNAVAPFLRPLGWTDEQIHSFVRRITVAKFPEPKSEK